MAILKYAEYFSEQLEVRDLKKSQASEYIKMVTGYIIRTEQVYEFLEGKHCPNACMAAIWEQAFKVNLPPKYWGADDYRKASAK